MTAKVKTREQTKVCPQVQVRAGSTSKQHGVSAQCVPVHKNTLMQAAGKVKVQTPQISKCCSEENGIQVSRNKNCMPSVYVHMYYPIGQTSRFCYASLFSW